ncbi:TetR/AcrR family transcriptional regulator [Thalassospira lohafexi]|nr:TetR/AcrR family transcriptional regulator [Thalassospira lohafexi]
MSPENPTPKQVERRSRILEAAAHEMLDMRDDRTAVDRIAARAGTSKATIYRYFGDKTGLERAMVAWLCERARDPLEGVMVWPHNPRKTLLAIAEAFADGILRAPVMNVHRYVVARTPTHPELGEIFWDAGPEATYQTATKLVTQIHLPAHLRVIAPRQFAELFLNMLTSSIQLGYFCKGPVVLEKDDMGQRIEDAVTAFGFPP